jgi:hypothetical protein
MTADDQVACIQSPAHLLVSDRANIFQPGAREERHGKGSDAQQQGKEETEGRQEHQEGWRGTLAVLVRQDAGRPEPEQQEVASAAALAERRTKRPGVGHDGVAGEMQRLAGALRGVGVAGAAGILDDNRDDAEVGGVTGESRKNQGSTLAGSSIRIPTLLRRAAAPATDSPTSTAEANGNSGWNRPHPPAARQRRIFQNTSLGCEPLLSYERQMRVGRNTGGEQQWSSISTASAC